MDNKEVRDILLGRIVRYDEQFWTVAPPDVNFHFHGIRDGAGDVRLFGVTHLTRNYRVEGMELSAALSAAEMALYSMGRPMWLASMPKAKGVLFTPNWIAPVFLTVEQTEDGMRMVAYSGRSLVFGRLRCFIALRLLERRLPNGFTYIGRDKKPDKEPDKKEEKTEKAPQTRKKRAGSPKKKKTSPKRLQK